MLKWCTGYRAIPPSGFEGGEVFCIRTAGSDRSRLPTVHTCEPSIEIPVYDTYAWFSRQMARALKEDSFDIA